MAACASDESSESSQNDLYSRFERVEHLTSVKGGIGPASKLTHDEAATSVPSVGPIEPVVKPDRVPAASEKPSTTGKGDKI